MCEKTNGVSAKVDGIQGSLKEVQYEFLKLIAMVSEIQRGMLTKVSRHICTFSDKGYQAADYCFDP